MIVARITALGCGIHCMCMAVCTVDNAFFHSIQSSLAVITLLSRFYQPITPLLRYMLYGLSRYPFYRVYIKHYMRVGDSLIITVIYARATLNPHIRVGDADIVAILSIF